MTAKEKVLALLERMPDDISIELLLYRLELLRGVEQALEQVERGEVIDHDKLFDRLMKDDEKRPTSMVSGRQSGSASPKRSHRSKRTENGRALRKGTKSKSK